MGTVTCKQNWRAKLCQREPALTDFDVSTIDSIFSEGRYWQRFKDDRTTTVVSFEHDSTNYIIKRYNARNVWHHIKRAFRQSRAQRCWEMSEVFSQAGIEVAEPVLMYEKRFGPIRRNSYFVTRYLDGQLLLDQLPLLPEQEKQQVKIQIEQLFNKLKKHRLSHGDMKATNLLWVNQRVVLIDLDAATQHRFGIMQRRGYRRDLARFMKNWRDNAQLADLFRGLA